MSNIKKSPEDLKKIRCITLSDNEVKDIKRVANETSLTVAIRLLLNKVKQSQ